MIEVEKIIKILDEELVLRNKSYFTLQQANKILVERGIFQESDILGKTLKGFLEEQKITNASRTLHEPKQWRIHHSGTIYATKKSKLKDNSIVEKPAQDYNTGKAPVTCPSCGALIDMAHDLKPKTYLKCKNCSNIFHNPLSTNILFSGPIESKIKYVFENHGLKIVIGIALIVLISLIYFKTNETVYRGGEPKILTEKEKRTEKLISFATDIFHENEWCYNQWAFISNIKSAEDAYYGNSDVKIDFYPRALPNNGMLLYTTKLIIPSQELYSKRDPVYGVPLYFFYRFYFNDKDNLSAKYLVVVYDSDKSVTYDFKTRPVQRLINYKLALSKIEKWEKHKNQMAAQQKQIEKKQTVNECEQKQTDNSSTVCQKEKKYITDVYKMLTNNIYNLEYQAQNLPYTELAAYVSRWNRNANEIKNQYHQPDFNCFFAFDYNRMLSSYQQAGLEFIKVLDGSDQGDYAVFKGRVKESYLRLMNNEN